jgi:DNA-binding MarR family transcriptional regulator
MLKSVNHIGAVTWVTVEEVSSTQAPDRTVTGAPNPPAGEAVSAAAEAEVTPVDLDLASLAIRFMDQMKQSIREVAEDQRLSVAQLDVLRRLRHHGPSPMRRLAEQMNCEASNLTGLVDRLEVRGLVERQPEKGDRRVRLLALTNEGEALSQQAWVAVAQRCPLTNLPPERRALLDELLRDALRAPAPDAPI